MDAAWIETQVCIWLQNNGYRAAEFLAAKDRFAAFEAWLKDYMNKNRGEAPEELKLLYGLWRQKQEEQRIDAMPEHEKPWHQRRWYKAMGPRVRSLLTSFERSHRGVFDEVLSDEAARRVIEGDADLAEDVELQRRYDNADEAIDRNIKIRRERDRNPAPPQTHRTGMPLDPNFAQSSEYYRTWWRK